MPIWAIVQGLVRRMQHAHIASYPRGPWNQPHAQQPSECEPLGPRASAARTDSDGLSFTLPQGPGDPAQLVVEVGSDIHKLMT
eukprot:1946488-Amphidinium_carterae.1